MSYTITFRPQAREEYLQAISYYDERSSLKGDKFIASVDKVLQILMKLPFSSPVLKNDIRKAIVKDYPYIILYVILEQEINILSVFNTYQDPKKWENTFL